MALARVKPQVLVSMSLTASSPPTLLWPSTSPRRNGMPLRTSRPRPAASPWPRPLPALLSSTISADAKHTSDMDPEKVVGNINPEVPVHSTRIRVGRNIDGFGLSPGITKQQRIDIEKLISSALSKLSGDLAGKYYPLTGMEESVRQQLVDD